MITNTPGDPDLAVPVGQRARYEKAFAQFSRVFPDMFYMQERGRNYFDTTKDRGRLLDAGFHSLMGYFRDDQPLYELLLDDAQQAELDELWLEMDVVASTTARMYAQFFENGSRQGGGGAIPLPADTGPKEEPVTSAARLGVHQGGVRAGRDHRRRARHPGGQRLFRLGERQGPARGEDAAGRGAWSPRCAADVRGDGVSAPAQRATRKPSCSGAYRASRQQDGLSHEAAMRESIVAVLMSPGHDVPDRPRGLRTGDGSHCPTTHWQAGSVTSCGRRCRMRNCSVMRRPGTSINRASSRRRPGAC